MGDNVVFSLSYSSYLCYSSCTMKETRLTIPDIKNHKGNTPLVCLTAYTAPMARILDAHTDILLVGDSLGMVVYGMESTLPVTIDMMVNHGKAVTNNSKHALVVVDMPFASYQQSPGFAFDNAAHIIASTGCNAVKLEGGEAMADTVHFLTTHGIPVMGHVGLMPQHVHVMGGFRYQGKEHTQAQQIMRDAKAIEAAGAFAIVLEGIPETLAADITAALSIPTIGIGASAQCDGQVLVTEDMLGVFPEFTPKFVKQYSNLAETINNAVETFASDVRSRIFPSSNHCI